MMATSRTLSLGCLLALLSACAGGAEPAKAPAASFRDVTVVVLEGSDEPLPFDPRGGRLTIVTSEITRLVGHPIVLELDAALSPELRGSLEETVLASFEGIVRELVVLQKQDPTMFAKAREIERVVCAYDAVARDSEGRIEGSGKVLAVRAPPDRFPLLERWVLTQAVYDAFVGDLEARWGEADPTKLAPHEHAPYFGYMTKTRPGAGYLWIAARSKNGAGSRRDDDLRVEHVGRIVKLAGVVDPRTPLARKVRRFLLESAPFLGGFQADPPAAGFHADPTLLGRVVRSYEAWLGQSRASFDDEEELLFAHAIFEHRSSICGHDCSPDAVFPGFDRLGFGLSIYDAWVKEGARLELPTGPRGELYKAVVCPVKRRGEAETEIRYGCSAFFALALRDEAHRARLADTITKRRDTKLLETALLNLGHDGGRQALALVEALSDEALFRHGVSVLFYDLARRDDVKGALESAAPRWWRDRPSRRGLALLVMARQWEGLDVHYGDHQWTHLVGELGGPIGRDVLASYLSEGPRAVEMAPKIWPVLAKSSDRDDLVAKSLPVLLDRDRDARSSRAGPTLVLLRTRLCGEKNVSGLASVRASIERWARAHPDERASVSNALADFTLARCPAAPRE